MNTGFKWKKREDFTEDCIGGLDIWDENGRKVSCKGLQMLEGDFCVVERHICVLW